MRLWKRWLYRFNRWLVQLVARPTYAGEENLSTDRQHVYVLHRRAVSDLIILDLVCEDAGLTSPLEPIDNGALQERSRFFPLLRSSSGRITMQTVSPRLTRLIENPDASIDLVPVSIFWGRAQSGEGSVVKTLTSENWAASGRIKRLSNLFINRRNIVVQLGRPLSLEEAADATTPEIALRRTARYLRVRLRQQRIRTLGPDFSHRRTLLAGVLTSQSVQAVINEQVKAGAKRSKVERIAAKQARTIASDMSHPTVRVLSRLLTWFWNRIYDEVELVGLENIEELTLTHTPVYAPSHRSHLDYLLMSYLLYYKNYMIPHIAAGDNLNLPILGGILRRGGAIFMRRSFRDDPLYAAIFEEYLYRVYQQGHSVEFFPEGGRSRTGRLLPAKFGLLKMTLSAQQRGLDKPLAIIPVYFGYEKLVEAASYLSELRGANKRSESLFDVFKNIRLIRQNFGTVRVNVGTPITLDEWLLDRDTDSIDEQCAELAREITVRTNSAAHVNPINLVSLVTLATPRAAIESSIMCAQIEAYRNIIQATWQNPATVVSDAPQHVIEHAESLELLDREAHAYGDVLSHDPNTAILMTWYRNNVVHLLAYPSLIACLVVRRRRAISLDQLQAMLDMIFPYIAVELSCHQEAGFESCVDALVTANLLEVDENGVLPPNQGSVQHLQLSLLANLVMPTLERMYIVISQIDSPGVTLNELKETSQQLANKISRLYGINAPEFSDEKLFTQFTNELIERRAITVDEEGGITNQGQLDRVVRAAEYVIEPQIRLGVASHKHINDTHQT